jgi:hypothetical protein
LSTQNGAVTITDLMLLPGGAFEIVWDTADTVNGPAVHQTTYEIFDADGTPITGQVPAGTYSGSGQVPIRLQESIQLADGTTLKLSTVFATASPARSMVLQQFDAGGTALGDPIEVSTGDVAYGGIGQLSNGDVVFVQATVSRTGVYGIGFRLLDNTSADTTAPAAIDFFPAAGSSMLPPDWNLGITFDEAVQAGTGTITLQTAAGQVVQSFAPGDPGLHFIGSSLVIDPAIDLQPGTAYQLVVSPDAVQDLAGNAFAGVSGYGFTTAGGAPAGDSTAPVAIDFFPAAGSALPPDWNFGITFNEDIKAGSGTVTLQMASGEVVQTFAAGDPGLQFAGHSLIINPSADLLPGATYTLVVSADAVVDLAGNAYGGVSGYSFTTEAALVGLPSEGMVG